jgi:phosphoglucomutase
MQTITVPTLPHANQKPGTGGLRARSRTFMEKNFLENFIQSAIDVFKSNDLPAEFFVIAGDGRFLCAEFLPRIIKILAANGVKRIMVVGRDVTAPTPAASHIIRKYGADGGFVMSASHNPGGIDGDFGIKVELSNGGGAPENFTDTLYARTKEIAEYRTLDMPDADALTLPIVEFVDATRDYADLMESMFDFPLIRKWFESGGTIRFDAMWASTGAVAHEILVNRLGAKPDSIIRGTAKPDFGGLHPEPNLRYNPEMTDFMMRGAGADLGAACDGDGDRNMIFGRGIFVCPPDSLAIMTRHHGVVPYFRNGLKGVARSLPTSSAVDLVAKKMGLKCHCVPTGWKWFASLLDADMISLCGEESFGQGGDYIREKDAMFAILFWLNILAATGKTVGELMEELWRDFGRTFYTQYSYEGVDATRAAELCEYIRTANLEGAQFGAAKIKSKRELTYEDPASGATASNVGTEILTTDGTRIFFRLSGTGTVGATLRFYAEKFEQDPTKFTTDSREYMREAVAATDALFKIPNLFPNAPKTIAM